ncbi:hypothetical protein RND71_003493 [Anisodus tanguticus]|uniref:Uncharacterized protein n=1 Tax=Anisodus tanguticus TaxID=243964 RepID=A0AAE1VQ13_9SOLA|nr:hypothetical protein RND71_003493 [Anisodus tanguticus]
MQEIYSAKHSYKLSRGPFIQIACRKSHSYTSQVVSEVASTQHINKPDDVASGIRSMKSTGSYKPDGIRGVTHSKAATKGYNRQSRTGPNTWKHVKTTGRGEQQAYEIQTQAEQTWNLVLGSHLKQYVKMVEEGLNNNNNGGLTSMDSIESRWVFQDEYDSDMDSADHATADGSTPPNGLELDSDDDDASVRKLIRTGPRIDSFDVDALEVPGLQRNDFDVSFKLH